MKRLIAMGATVVTLAGFAACSAGGGKQDGAGNNDAAGGAGAGDGLGGDLASGGSGFGGDDACQALGVEAAPKSDAADIIFVIDTSASMVEESGFVRDRMNAFSQQIVSSGVDARVHMLAMAPFIQCGFCPGICIAPPLGSGGCPGDENPAAGYFHPSSEIKSKDALTKIVDLYGAYAPNLRPDSHKYIVIVTDDNATDPYIADAQVFLNTFNGLDPMSLIGTTVHAIYCFDDSGPCVQKGQVYEDLVNLTGGIHGNLALQDFQPIFDDVAAQVIDDAALPCQYPVPPPPEGEELDPSKVNVVFTDGNGDEHPILQVPSLAECDAALGGWYYDNPSNPTTVHLCPASCDQVSPDPNGRIDILFGCTTQVLPPK